VQAIDEQLGNNKYNEQLNYLKYAETPYQDYEDASIEECGSSDDEEGDDNCDDDNSTLVLNNVLSCEDDAIAMNGLLATASHVRTSTFAADIAKLFKEVGVHENSHSSENILQITDASKSGSMFSVHMPIIEAYCPQLAELIVQSKQESASTVTTIKLVHDYPVEPLLVSIYNIGDSSVPEPYNEHYTVYGNDENNSRLAAFVNNQKYHDIKLKLKVFLNNSSQNEPMNQQQEMSFYAHKCILKCRSEYFKTMFNSGMLESECHEIDLSEYINSERQAMAFLHYLYCDSIAPVFTMNSNDEERMECCNDLLALIQTSQFYDLPRLKDLCLHKICECIDLNNVVELMRYACTQHFYELFEYCFLFIENAQTCAQSPLDSQLNETEKIVFAVASSFSKITPDSMLFVYVDLALAIIHISQQQDSNNQYLLRKLKQNFYNCEQFIMKNFIAAKAIMCKKQEIVVNEHLSTHFLPARAKKIASDLFSKLVILGEKYFARGADLNSRLLS